MYQGEYFQLKRNQSFGELILSSTKDSVNTLGKAALEELSIILDTIDQSDLSGLIIRSDKKLFCGGANVKEFRALFAQGEQAVNDYLTWVHSIYNRIEDLEIPKVAVLNGFTAGGGAELALLADYRLMTTDAAVTFPEVKLGIFPGWGGLTRLPRLLGLDTALQWLTTGKKFNASKALTCHFADGVIDSNKQDPVEAAIQVLNSCLKGELDWQERKKEKLSSLRMNQYELGMSVSVAKGMIAKTAGKHYPAPMIMLNAIEKAAGSCRDEALAIEREHLCQCVKTGVADALVSVFLSDMAVKAKTKGFSSEQKPLNDISVLGAGIMGGGIAYVSADKGMHVHLKDINQQGLDLGLEEANKLLAKQVTKKRKTPLAMGQVLNRIQPTLHDISLAETELVIEAVVENPNVKANVLADIEQKAPNALIASNTSTLNISGLANSLQRPENFCGIHFFNPVHRMPLVEVIKGEKTSDETINKAVQYVKQLGKTPIVINDCAGFLVNRCLTPYFLAFNQLLTDGADISIVDKIMTKQFGWPMGPAMLLDVIGLDTTAHCIDVMDDAFPERLQKPQKNIIQTLVDEGYLGQKNHQGFYQHVADRKGRLKPLRNTQSDELIAKLAASQCEDDAETMMMRLMIPMMFEAVRCLDEGIVASPEEADIAMLYGTGFPAFRGGLFYYMDQLGMEKLISLAETFKHLGALYQIPEGVLNRAQQKQTFYTK
ncbi:TPA: fatty acid oxidation complex subunit alpha FadB [Photobacterium damselae]